MLIPLSTDTTPVTHPSSDNLINLIIITGGLLFICLVLLMIVVLRSKARRKKLGGVDQPVVQKVKKVKEPKPTKVKPVQQPVSQKQVVEVTIKKEEVKAIVEVKKEVVQPVVETKVPVIKKEEPKVEVKPPVVDPWVKTQDKKPDEVIIKIEEKKEEPSIKTTDNTVSTGQEKPEVKPITTSAEEKKDHFRKVLSETHSKEDNLKVLQERLAELSKEKKTVVTFNPSTKTTDDSVSTGQDDKKKEPTEHVKLVDLTALINEKLQTKTDPSTKVQDNKIEPVIPFIKKEEPKVEEKKEDTSAPINIVTEEDKTKILAEEESHKIMTPFIEKIKEDHLNEEPEKVIEKIEEDLSAFAQGDNPSKKATDDSVSTGQEDKTIPPVNPSTQTNEPPKTFTEWLSTLKK